MKTSDCLFIFHSEFGRKGRLKLKLSNVVSQCVQLREYVEKDFTAIVRKFKKFYEECK